MSECFFLKFGVHCFSTSCSCLYVYCYVFDDIRIAVTEPVWQSSSYCRYNLDINLSSVISELFKHFCMMKYFTHSYNSDLQFGFKEKLQLSHIFVHFVNAWNILCLARCTIYGCFDRLGLGLTQWMNERTDERTNKWFYSALKSRLVSSLMYRA